MIQDLSGSWYIKGTGESTVVMDSPVPLMHHNPDRSCTTDPDPDHPKGTQPKMRSLNSGMVIGHLGNILDVFTVLSVVLA